MNALEVLKITEESERNKPQWKIDLLSARQDIVQMLLTASYHALGITPPTDDIVIVRAAQIAEKADVCNRDLKEAFDRAIDAKMDKEIKTPITYGDINKAAIMIARENNRDVVGKWKNALPRLSDNSLWSKSVCQFAATHGKSELEDMMKRRLTNGL